MFLTCNFALTVVKWVGFFCIAIILSALEEEPESDDEEDDTKIVNTSTKRPASGGGAKTPQVCACMRVRINTDTLSVGLSEEFSFGLVLLLPVGVSCVPQEG